MRIHTDFQTSSWFVSTISAARLGRMVRSSLLSPWMLSLNDFWEPSRNYVTFGKGKVLINMCTPRRSTITQHVGDLYEVPVESLPHQKFEHPPCSDDGKMGRIFNRRVMCMELRTCQVKRRSIGFSESSYGYRRPHSYPTGPSFLIWWVK
jgi:hypothetical protein